MLVVVGDIVLGLDKAASGHDCQLTEEGESYVRKPEVLHNMYACEYGTGHVHSSYVVIWRTLICWTREDVQWGQY